MSNVGIFVCCTLLIWTKVPRDGYGVYGVVVGTATHRVHLTKQETYIDLRQIWLKPSFIANSTRLETMSRYDTIAASYAKGDRLAHPTAQIPYRWLIDAIPSWKRLRVLDLACGSGDSAAFLAEAGATTVHGLDASAEMVRLAKRRNLTSSNGAPLRFAQHDCRVPRHAWEIIYPNQPKPTGAVRLYDVVTAVYLLNYAESRDDLLGMARMARMNLVNGGPFIAVTEHPEYPVIHDDRKAERFTWLDEPMMSGARIELTLLGPDGNPACEPFVFRHWGQMAVQTALLQTGFTMVRWFEFGVPLYRAVGADPELTQLETRIGIMAW